MTGPLKSLFLPKSLGGERSLLWMKGATVLIFVESCSRSFEAGFHITQSYLVSNLICLWLLISSTVLNFSSDRTMIHIFFLLLVYAKSENSTWKKNNEGCFLKKLDNIFFLLKSIEYIALITATIVGGWSWISHGTRIL